MPTHGIANKGFSGMLSFVSRINFGNGVYERSPKSLTCHRQTFGRKLPPVLPG
jgi:hypothetical protein